MFIIQEIDDPFRDLFVQKVTEEEKIFTTKEEDAYRFKTIDEVHHALSILGETGIYMMKQV